MLSLSNVVIRHKTTGSCLISLPQLTIDAGQVATLMGPSGSGKSTLLRWVLGEPLPDFDCCGEIYWQRDDQQQRLDTLPIHQRKIGLMYQKGDLFPHLSVLDNLRFALPRDLSKAQQQQRIEQALNEVQLLSKLNVMPQQLSGGEQSRLALIRSLLAEPNALLLDEPFSALDTELRQSIRRFTYALLKSRQIPALLVTHDAADKGDGPCLTLSENQRERKAYD